MSEKCKKSSFKDKSLSLTHQKNFTQTNFDAIENFEKVTQVQWKSFVKFVFKISPPPCFAQKYQNFVHSREKNQVKNNEFDAYHCAPLESFLNFTTAAICHQQLRNSGLESEFLYQTKNTIWPAIMLIIFLNYDNDQN